MKIAGMDAASTAFTNSSSASNATGNSLPGIQKTNVPSNNIQDTNKGEYPVTEKTVTEAADRLNRILEGLNRRCVISVHEKTHGIIVKVVDDQTGEVIREVPPKKILDMVAGMMEMAGLIVDERR